MRSSLQKFPLILLSLLLFGEIDLVMAQNANGSGESRVVVPGQNRDATKTFSGPWGTISFREAIIEAPEWAISDGQWLANWQEGTVWRFQGNIPQFRQVLETARFSLSEIGVLTNPPTLRNFGTHLEIYPPENILLNIPRQSRGYLYSKLKTKGERDLYEVPIQLAPGGVSRISNSKTSISPDIVDLITQLTYTRRTGILYISDLHYIAGKAKSDEERLRIAQFISREPTGTATLSLDIPQEERSNLLSYWSARGKNTTAETILSSSLENPEITSLDLSHILPSLPKRLLNTYASQHSSIGIRHPNCYATALSFFEDELSPQLVETLQPDISNRYSPATRPWEFGDLVVILSSSGQWLHTCNYIAGEILFTKNGKNPERPWVIQTMDDVFASYLREDSVTVAFFRLRE